jgi:hypothetical protein
VGKWILAIIDDFEKSNSLSPLPKSGIILPRRSDLLLVGRRNAAA